MLSGDFMIFKMYYEDDVYLLDKERGKGKIYEIINKSAPKRVNKIFSRKTYAHVPSGTYYFYIKGYELKATWLYPSIGLLFYFLDKIITLNKNLLLTVQYEGPCSYVVSMPINEDYVRLIFLDRDGLKRGGWSKRFRDEDLSHTSAVCDIIVNKYELIRQFNDEIKRIYKENTYYLSKEYEEKCRTEGSFPHQEYVLNRFKDYYEKFDRYLDNPEKYLEESYFSIDRWKSMIYTAEKLDIQVKEFKKSKFVISEDINKIMVMGNIFNDDKGRLTLNEPVSIFYGNDFYPDHLDIDFTETGSPRIGYRTFDFLEKSAVTRDISWQNVSKYFSKNIIKHKLIDIVADTYGENNNLLANISFVMDSGYKLTLKPDSKAGYMVLYEEKVK